MLLFFISFVSILNKKATEAKYLSNREIFLAFFMHPLCGTLDIRQIEGVKMLLQKDTCQKIIDRFINILDTNINIMDLEGKIIASTTKSRVNTFHKGAHLCVLSGNQLVITKDNQSLYKGCEPGINLPIYYDSEIIGVVGITGAPEEIKGYTLVVKELVELIVVENEQRKYVALKEETKRSFFAQLFNESMAAQVDVLESRALIADFHFKGDKRIVLVETWALKNDLKNKKDSFEKQRQKTKLKAYIKTKLQPSENVIDLYEDEIILILNDSLSINSFLEEIKGELEQHYQTALRLYVSETCSHLKDYAKNYKKTKLLIELYKNRDTPESILWVAGYKLELILNTLAPDEKAYYLSTFSTIFDKNQKDQSYYDLLETIKIYFESNMNGIDTARRMNLHRNTVRYRINKFKDLYQVDVTKPYECMKLYLAIKLFLG